MCRTGWAGYLALVGLLAGCAQSGPSQSGPTSTDGGPVPDAAAPTKGDGPLTAARLKPTFHEIGADGRSPTHLRIDFETEAFKTADEGQVRFRLEPSTGGRESFRRDGFDFHPHPPFRPATRYTAFLSEVHGKAGVIRPQTPWRYAFETPAFALDGLERYEVDFQAHFAVVELLFTAEISPERLATRAHWTVDGSPVTRTVVYSRGEDASVARVRIHHPDLKADARIRLELDAGVAWAHDPNVLAPKSTRSLHLRDGEPLTIHSVDRSEGPTGFYVNVVCDDRAAGGRRYYWNPSTYDGLSLSRRCVLDKASESLVRISPPVDFRLTQSEGGFRLQGDFAKGDYVVTIMAGARSVDGGVLAEKFVTQITVPRRSARATFESKGRYLPRKSWGNLPVRHLNAATARVRVRHIPRRNLLFWLSGYDEDATVRSSDFVADVKIPLLAKPDTVATTWIDLAEIVPNPKRGVYEIDLRAGGNRDVRRLLLTDMQLIVKRRATAPGDAWSRRYSAWVVNSHTGQPVRGVALALSRQSGHKLAECRTGADGGCALETSGKADDDSAPFVVIATKGSDFTYLKFSDLHTSTGDSAVYGEAWHEAQPYRLAAYADRGVYRPGETAHLVGIVRGEDHLAPPKGLPVEIEIDDPKGRTLFRRTLKSNAAGLVSFDPKFADFATTGHYTARFLVGKQLVGTHGFSVESFVPERMKVAVKGAKTALLAGDAAPFEVTASYLFGGSAKGSAVSLSCSVAPFRFTVKGLADYTFGLASLTDARPLDLGTVAGKLGESGTLRLGCPVEGRMGGFAFAGRLQARASVQEAGSGRATTATGSVVLHPAPYYIGLRADSKRAEPGQPLRIEGRIVDWDGNPVPTANFELDVQLSRIVGQYGWSYDERRGRELWRHTTRSESDGQRRVKVVGGVFRFELVPSQASEGYLVAVGAGLSSKARTELRLSGARAAYDWGWDLSDSGSTYTNGPAAPTGITLQLPEIVSVEQGITGSFKAPYAGRALLTLETDGVESARWLDVKPGLNSFHLPLSRFTPNVYVSVFVIKDPHLESRKAYLPDRAFGARSVRIRPARYTQPLSLSVPKTLRPHQTLTVAVDLGRRDIEETFVTVAAVDQGILSLTRFESPDPTRQIFARRGLGVETFDTIGWALKLADAQSRKATGGGRALGKGAAKPVKPVALWSGLVPVDRATGKAQVEFEVPQYRGALRIMVVSVSAQRIGHASAEVVVRDPLVLQTTLPRFMTGGDIADVPVFLTNMSGKPRTVRVSVTAHTLDGVAENGDAIALVGDREQTVELAEGVSARLIFKVKALRQFGGARLEVRAESGALISHDSVEIPLRPAGSSERQLEVVELTPGAEIELTAGLSNWAPGSTRSSLWVTTIDHAEAFDHLRFLVQYPHGCVEQTTSSSRPLLFVGNLLRRSAPDLVGEAGVAPMVQHGIDRLLSMQTPSGGLGYWPGAREPDAWGTAYATHFLLEARAKRYRVPEQRLGQILSWIERTLDRDDSTERYANAYMHFVLAKAGRARRAQALALAEGLPAHPKGRQAERAYLLKAAIYLSGDRRFEADLRRLDTSPIANDRHTGGSFYSDQRRRGFMLGLYLDLFGPEGARPMADLIAAKLRRPSGRYTTQELVWSVTGLGKWAQAEAIASASQAVLRVDGEPMSPLNEEGHGTFMVARSSERKLVLTVPKDAPKGLKVYLGTEGVRPGVATTITEGLQIERTWLDATGAPIDPSAIALGALVYARLSLTNVTEDDLTNLALVDRFPAGFEVENPRLGRGQQPGWVEPSAQWGIDHMNIRDDRLEVFGALESKGRVEVIYALRAVTAGQFSAPPVQAEAMYDPAIRARSGAGDVQIIGPWEGRL